MRTPLRLAWDPQMTSRRVPPAETGAMAKGELFGKAKVFQHAVHPGTDHQRGHEQHNAQQHQGAQYARTADPIGRGRGILSVQ